MATFGNFEFAATELFLREFSLIAHVFRKRGPSAVLGAFRKSLRQSLKRRQKRDQSRRS
jgi:hypothetical protein